jgi:nucleoside 2-deoxyribosyltransferase
MTSVFISAALFSAVEREYNDRITEALRENGYEVFLPQRASDRVRAENPERPGEDPVAHRELIGRLTFDACLDGIKSSDLLIALLDGTDVDSGTAWEIGYAYAKGIPVLGVRSDKRTTQRGPVNIMIAYTLRQALYFDDPSISISQLIDQILSAVKSVLPVGDPVDA